MEQRVEKATTPISLHGSRNKGFTLMELMVVLIIIAIMSAVVYPYFKKGMESIKSQREKAYLELFFKRALILSRFDRRAKIVSLGNNGSLLLDGKKPKKSIDGVKELKMNGKKVKSIAILPASFYTITIVFDKYNYSFDLYTGEIELKKD
ncbi:type IV pilin protein [Thermotomaculum hydrothermale]|nr:type II secretion system protein [Thermotomaculum hydrothermale]